MASIRTAEVHIPPMPPAPFRRGRNTFMTDVQEQASKELELERYNHEHGRQKAIQDAIKLIDTMKIHTTNLKKEMEKNKKSNSVLVSVNYTNAMRFAKEFVREYANTLSLYENHRSKMLLSGKKQLLSLTSPHDGLPSAPIELPPYVTLKHVAVLQQGAVQKNKKAMAKNIYFDVKKVHLDSLLKGNTGKPGPLTEFTGTLRMYEAFNKKAAEQLKQNFKKLKSTKDALSFMEKQVALSKYKTKPIIPVAKVVGEKKEGGRKKTRRKRGRKTRRKRCRKTRGKRCKKMRRKTRRKRGRKRGRKTRNKH